MTALTVLLCLVLTFGLVSTALNILTIVQVPGQPQNYVQLAWSVLLVAFPISVLARSALRTSMLIFTGSTLAGLVVCLWNAALSRGDWVNDFWAALFLVLALVWWLVIRWARARRA